MFAPSQSVTEYIVRSTTMSKLLRDAAAFKATLQRQDATSWHSQTRNSSTSNGSAAGPVLPNAGDVAPPQKKKRPKSSMLASGCLEPLATDYFQ